MRLGVPVAEVLIDILDGVPQIVMGRQVCLAQQRGRCRLRCASCRRDRGLHLKAAMPVALRLGRDKGADAGFHYARPGALLQQLIIGCG